MDKKWKKLFKKVEDYDSKLSNAIKDIEMEVVYQGFEYDDEPNVDMATSHELIMSWHGMELNQYEFAERIDEKGFIEPDDFGI